MATADVSYNRVLRDAQQLTPEEQALLIGQLAQRLVTSPQPQSGQHKMTILTRLREELRQIGHVPPTPEEVQSSIEAERGSWND